MLCDKCGKNIATTHIKQIINGKSTEYNLCNECAVKEGYNSFNNTSFGDVLSSVFGDTAYLNAAKKSVTCPTCGASFTDISNTGKVGCADCYKTFKNELLPYLKRVHGTVKHMGKKPQDIYAYNTNDNSNIETLKKELKQLISEEEFEAAALVRDKIKELEAKGNE